MLRFTLLTTLAAGATFFSSCAPPLEVTQFHLRDENATRSSVAMIEAEANYRYNNEVEEADRKQKHGHYYSVRWSKSLVAAPQEPVTVKFAYQQPDQGRKVRTQTVVVTPEQARKAKFQITNSDYLQSGRVLAWRVELIQAGRVIAHEQSFLW